MSNSLAIATVTEAIRTTIQGAIPGSGVNGALVTALRPDAPTGLPQPDQPGVNVFLFRVTPNLAGQNADLPTRRADGSLAMKPQAALDLHYLLTFYGDDATLDDQRLLGATLLLLHSAPVLTRDFLRQVQSDSPFLNTSNLADQIDLVRVRPANLTLDETNKLWMTFPNVDYVLSVAYIAGVVLIDSDDPPPPSALPVHRLRTGSVPFSLATIDSVAPQPVDLSASSPTQIVLIGSNLDPSNDVSFTTPGQTTPLPGSVQPGAGGTQLVVTLPSGLCPGVNTVQLTRRDASPSSSSDRPRVVSQSNVAPFVIRPAIQNTDTTTPGLLVVTLGTTVGPRQQVTALLNQFGGGSASQASVPLGQIGGQTPLAFALAASPHPSQTASLEFDTSGIPPSSVPPELFGGQSGSIPPGTYLIRIRVDGAESPLETDGPTGPYIGPQVTF
jgi:hypothetical protein